MRKACFFLLLLLTSAAIGAEPNLTVRVTFSSSQRGAYHELWAVNSTSRQRFVSQAGPREEYVFPALSLPVDLFLYQGIGTDTLYIGSVAANSLAAHVHFPLNLRKNLLGHYICPKCGKADKTAEIVNSDAPRVRMAIVAGDTTYSSIVHRKKYESCIGGGGRGYCQRDKIQF